MTTAAPVLWVETTTQTFAGHILSSTVRRATQSDIDEAKRLHLLGQCPHTVIYDEAGWMYDARTCATCGAGLGLI